MAPGPRAPIDRQIGDIVGQRHIRLPHLEHGRDHDNDIVRAQPHRAQLNLASFAQHLGLDRQIA
jgi:hypothetical protein